MISCFSDQLLIVVSDLFILCIRSAGNDLHTVRTFPRRVLFDQLGIEGDSHEAQEIYENNLAKGAFYIPGAKELLENLYGKYRLYMATNGIIKVQTPRLDATGIRKYFDGIFVSERIGFNKPDKRFFDAVFEAIEDFKPEETVIVGDGLASDIKGGINAGIKTIYFNPRGFENETGIIPDFEIRSLDELPTLLQAL